MTKHKMAYWPLSKLKPYAKNPRVNDHAVDKIAENIVKFGFKVPIIAKSNGEVLDGHLRIKAALKLGLSEVPVLIADDLTETEIKAFRLSVNRMAELAQWDMELLSIELEELKAIDFDLELIDFGDLIFDPSKDPDTIDDVSPELPGAHALKVDMSFKSDLPWNIPQLREDMLSPIPPNLKTWAGQDATPDDGESWYMWNWRTDSLRGSPKDRLMIGFYTDDYRFDNLWTEPDIYVSKMLNLGTQIAITPNYSLWYDQAKACHLWAIYRSRWIARYMQEAGIAIIPDINWADDSSFEFCLLGIPKHAPAVAVQLQTLKGKAETMRAINGLRRALFELEPQCLLAYGHKKANEVVEKTGYTGPVHYIINRVNARSDLMKANQV